ncbi:hypothetical protein [Nostoc sp. C052]|uniref:hypothetical protein n=1 Tax=Nostoc sp. C052 TaxID=2576902 RepID=UPI0015C300B0|nr:hypothetical protein [Nostoc sp. C052]
MSQWRSGDRSSNNVAWVRTRGSFKRFMDGCLERDKALFYSPRLRQPPEQLL